MRRILRDLKILILANLWLVPVLAGLVGALFYFVAPPPPMHARLATGAEFPGWPMLLAPLFEALLWPLASWLLLVPQRRAPDPDENRPL